MKASILSKASPRLQRWSISSFKGCLPLKWIMLVSGTGPRMRMMNGSTLVLGRPGMIMIRGPGVPGAGPKHGGAGAGEMMKSGTLSMLQAQNHKSKAPIRPRRRKLTRSSSPPKKPRARR